MESKHELIVRQLEEVTTEILPKESPWHVEIIPLRNEDIADLNISDEFKKPYSCKLVIKQ